MKPVWIVAPTSGIFHVAGEGLPLREVKPGTRLLCGWVLHSVVENPRVRDETKEGKKCQACVSFLKKSGS